MVFVVWLFGMIFSLLSGSAVLTNVLFWLGAIYAILYVVTKSFGEPKRVIIIDKKKSIVSITQTNLQTIIELNDGTKSVINSTKVSIDGNTIHIG